MGCDLYGASNLEGHNGLCRANPGTAYGATEDKPGAVFTQGGVIVPDPTITSGDQPWADYIGETLRSCDSRQGYYEIADSGPHGATFDHDAADAVRGFPNMSQDRVSLSAFGGRAGTLCIKADQPAIREGIIRTIRGGESWYNPLHWFDGECPTGLSDQQCDALASSMERLRPPTQDHLVEFFFLLAAFTVGPDVYHSFKNWLKNRRGGGNGDGDGNGGGGGISPEQAGRMFAEFLAAQGQGAVAPQGETAPVSDGASEPVSAGDSSPVTEPQAAGFSAMTSPVLMANVAGVDIPLPAELAHLADSCYSAEGFAQQVAPLMAQTFMNNGIGGDMGWNQAQWTSFFESAMSTGINNAVAVNSGAHQTFTADTLLTGMMQMGGTNPVSATLPGNVSAVNVNGVVAPSVTVVPAPITVPQPVVVPEVAPVFVPRAAPVLVP